MKTIKQNIPAQSFKSNTETKQSYRVIGTVDVNGKGMEHPLADVDPFIFLDETCMRGDEAWPFPKHPHAGLVAMTYMLNGEIQPWDSINGKQPFTNRAGGLYYINSGSGLQHEEEPMIASGALRWLQCWINPDIYKDELPAPTTQLIKPEAVPVVELPQGNIRVVIGNAFNQTSPAKPDWPIQYLHVYIKPNQSLELPIPDADWQGFIYILGGHGVFGANQMQGVLRDCLVLGNETSQSVQVTNSGNDVLEFVFLCGKPHRKPFYKFLVDGGAIITKTNTPTTM